MTTPALLTREDAKRLAEAAKASGCAFIVRRGDVTVTIVPDGHSLAGMPLDKCGEDGPISLNAWRDRRGQDKGTGRA